MKTSGVVVEIVNDHLISWCLLPPRDCVPVCVYMCVNPVDVVFIIIYLQTNNRGNNKITLRGLSFYDHLSLLLRCSKGNFCQSRETLNGSKETIFHSHDHIFGAAAVR